MDIGACGVADVTELNGEETDSDSMVEDDDSTAEIRGSNNSSRARIIRILPEPDATCLLANNLSPSLAAARH
nr:MAG: hypothetical protein AM324_09535 [Candidatus Thorarchaeota archaeon SMTZ1-83]